MNKSNIERAAFILSCLLYAETIEDQVTAGRYKVMAYHAICDMAADLGYM